MLLILFVHISAICHVDTLIFLSLVNKGWESWRIAKRKKDEVIAILATYRSFRG